MTEEVAVAYDPATTEKAKITKANRLVEARYRLTVQEQRLILMYISLLSPSSEEFPVVRLKVKDVIETLGLKGESFYQELKKILKRLLSRVVEIPQGERDYLLVHWVESARYKHKEGEIILRLNPELKPYLLKLKEAFTTYYLKNALRLRSFYSVRLYELLKQYEGIGIRRFTLNELKQLLKIEETEYKKYSDFKRFVILSSQRELSKKTDISFDFKEIKAGRKVVAIEFIIHKNKDKKPELGNGSKEYDTFSSLPEETKRVIVDYLRTRQEVKNPLGLAKTLQGFDLEEVAREALAYILYDQQGHVKPEYINLEEEIFTMTKKDPSISWVKLLNYAVSYILSQGQG